MLFWLLAIPVRLPWQSSLQVVMAIVNTAAIIGSLLLARPRGGDGLLLPTAILIPIIFASLPGETYADIWNSSVALAPLILLCSSLGRSPAAIAWLLPVMVVMASFIAQAQSLRRARARARGRGAGRLWRPGARGRLGTLACAAGSSSRWPWERCAGWHRRSISWCTAPATPS